MFRTGVPFPCLNGGQWESSAARRLTTPFHPNRGSTQRGLAGCRREGGTHLAPRTVAGADDMEAAVGAVTATAAMGAATSRGTPEASLIALVDALCEWSECESRELDLE
jgi:hypothetical protein